MRLTGAATIAWVCVNSLVFPEIDYEEIDKVRGLEVDHCHDAPDSDEEARRMLGPT